MIVIKNCLSGLDQGNPGGLVSSIFDILQSDILRLSAMGDKQRRVRRADTICKFDDQR